MYPCLPCLEQVRFIADFVLEMTIWSGFAPSTGMNLPVREEVGIPGSNQMNVGVGIAVRLFVSGSNDHDDDIAD